MDHDRGHDPDHSTDHSADRSRDHGTDDDPGAVRPPLVPGLVLGRLLGRGAHGTVWAARDPATGERVAVKVGRRADSDRSAREVALLARIDHPHVVRLRNVVECPDGTRALVLDLAAGGSLADLVRARGPLGAGETVTLAVGVARTLADLHGLGLVHGDLTPGNVLLAEDGRPLVADLGVASVLGRDDAAQWGTPGFADPADVPAADPVRDVHALGALVRFCLTGSPLATASGPQGDAGADPLLALADLCTDPDPARRPDAGGVARVAWAAAPAVPVRPSGPSGPGGPVGRPGPGSALGDDSVPRVLEDPFAAAAVTRRIREAARAGSVAREQARAAAAERRRRRNRRLRLGLVAVVAVAVLAAGGAVVASRWLDGRGTTATGTTAPAVAPGAARAAPEVDVHRVVDRLAAGRAAAFAAASQAAATAALAAVDEPGSPALTADVALARRLAGAGLRLDGLRFVVGDVRVEGRDARTMTLRAAVATSAHRRVRADGTVEGTVAAAPARPVRLVVVRVGSAWRVRSVEPAAAAG